MSTAERKAHEVGAKYHLVAHMGKACGMDVSADVVLRSSVIDAVWKSIVRDNPELKPHRKAFVDAAQGVA